MIIFVGPVNITIQPEDTPPVIVDFTVSFLCQAQSIPAPMINWFKATTTGVGIPIIDNNNNILIIITSISINTTMSNLTITVSNEEDFDMYYCVASNGFFNATSNPAILTRGGEGTVYGMDSFIIKSLTYCSTCTCMMTPL